MNGQLCEAITQLSQIGKQLLQSIATRPPKAKKVIVVKKPLVLSGYRSGDGE